MYIYRYSVNLPKVAPDRSMSPSPRYMARLRRYGKVTDNIFFDYESMYDGSEAKTSGFNRFTMRGKMYNIVKFQIG